MELKHEVHQLNNQLHLLLGKENLVMVIEDYGWEEVELVVEEDELEEDVKPVEDNDDDPMSDIDSDHSDE